jgi:hypothetical protein
MALVLLPATLVDVLVVGVLGWLVLRAERTQAAGLAEQQAFLARLRGELAELLGDAERRARALDHALAMREATLRVLVQASARPTEVAGEPPSADPAEVRLLRDLELSLERPAPEH